MNRDTQWNFQKTNFLIQILEKLVGELIERECLSQNLSQPANLAMPLSGCLAAWLSGYQVPGIAQYGTHHTTQETCGNLWKVRMSSAVGWETSPLARVSTSLEFNLVQRQPEAEASYQTIGSPRLLGAKFKHLLRPDKSIIHWPSLHTRSLASQSFEEAWPPK